MAKRPVMCDEQIGYIACEISHDMRESEENRKRIRWSNEAMMRALNRIELYRRGVEKMMLNEDCGGDGWWKGFDMLKFAQKAKDMNCCDCGDPECDRPADQSL